MASKSFYKADKVQLLWNNAGSAILILTSTESSADSYYGEQGLHYVDMKGYSCIVPRGESLIFYISACDDLLEAYKVFVLLLLIM